MSCAISFTAAVICYRYKQVPETTLNAVWLIILTLGAATTIKKITTGGNHLQSQIISCQCRFKLLQLVEYDSKQHV